MAQDAGERLNQADIAALKEMAQWWRNRGDGAMSRRRLLGLLAGGGLGAASVGGFMAGEASAGTDSVGQIGTQSEPADAVLEDVMDSGGNNPMSFPGDGSVSVDAAQVNSTLTYPDGRAKDDTTGAEWLNGGLPSQQTFDGTTADSFVLPFETSRDDWGTYDNATNEWYAPETGIYLWCVYIDVDGLDDGENIQLGQRQVGSDANVSGSPHLANRQWAGPSGRVMAEFTIADYVGDTSQPYTMWLQYGGANTLTVYDRGDNSKLQIIKLDSRSAPELSL